jgi:hypothetical protein
MLRVLIGDHHDSIRRASSQSLITIGEPAFPVIPNLKYVERFDSIHLTRRAAEECVKALEQQQGAIESAK